MNAKNLKHLPEIVKCMDKEASKSFYEIEALQFKSNIIIEEILYPLWVQDWEDKEELLQQIKSKDLMEPVTTLMKNAEMNLLSPKELNNGVSYYYITISFDIKPLPALKGVFTRDCVNVFIIPYHDNNEELQVKIMLSTQTFLGHFYQIKNAKQLDVNTTNETDLYYLQKLSEAVELICNRFKITTEQNQGIFTEPVKEDQEKILEQFITITHARDFNDEQTVENFIKYYRMIQNEPQTYLELLIEEGYEDEETEPDQKDFYYELLSHFLFSYQDDWKMDHEALSEYISEEIGQPFTITYEETQQRPHLVAEKIEAQSDYTMLNIDTQIDSYSFFICKKTEKAQLLEYARKLNFPIEDF